MHARHSRTLRGLAATAAATWLAAVSHTLGGGTPPSAALLLVVIALAAPLGVALAGRRLSLVRLALTVIATQVLLHVAFASTSGLDPTAGAHVHGGPLPDGIQSAALLPDPAMTIAHALAAVVTIALLHRGERALRAVARGLRDLVARLVVRLPQPVAVAETPMSAAVPAPILTRVASVVSRRGPPVFVPATR